MEDKSADGDWESFQTKLMEAKSSHRGKEGKGPRYAVYDFDYELEAGEGKRYYRCTHLHTGRGWLTLA